MNGASAAGARLLKLIMAMFFAFGFCTVLVDTLVPKFKSMYSLSYTEVMLTQFCFFGAYFVVSAPAGALIGRIGYLKSITAGLLTMALGAAGFIPASLFSTYWGFLLALFILASGVTIVQVAANPVVAVAGPAAMAPSRLTLAQALNSLATCVGPFLGARAFLAGLKAPPTGAPGAALVAFRHEASRVFMLPFAALAVVLMLLALVCWRLRALSPPASGPRGGRFLRLLPERRLLFGALSIFTYVGAEVSIGSSMANYLMQPAVLGVAAVVAGSYVSVYWGGAMVGRFAGTFVLRLAPPPLVLLCAAAGAGTLALASSFSSGALAAGLLLAVGLFNSIQFPTIFTLAIDGLGDDTPEASGLICLAIVGGAVVPLATGAVADAAGLSHALVVPVLCYAWIAAFAALVWQGKLRPRGGHG